MKVRANRLVIFTLCTALLCSQILPVQADSRTLRQAALAASLNDAFATALGANLNAALAGSPFALPAGLPATASASSTTATAATFVPGPESKPLVVARVQSTYTPGGLIDNTLIITYTAINRMPLDRLSGATIDLKLAPGVTLVSGPAYLELPDGTLSFALGEITPADGASVAIVVRTPGTVGQIDAGARASASLANQRVTAQTAPARLVSDAFSAHLGQQPEFMFNDVDLLEVAGLVEQDAARAFALVRDATHWEAYLGSLRGARGTWWSEAGNALDRASLLLGVLRTIGVPSRYVRGSLPLARQHELIGQMFGDTVSQIGSVSAENQYDPYTDAKLLAAAADHWWVEADLGSGWQALDPNFKPAAIGNVFGTSSTVVASIAAQDRHWTKIALTVEHLPALTGPAGKLETFKAFELELPTAQIAGVPTVIGHFVRSTFDGGAVFYNIRHYYTPFIAIGGIRPDATIYRGDEYLEQITNFPLASQRVTAASFDVTIYGPGVPTQTYQDEIVDRIGKLARREGGTVNSAGLSNTGPIVQDKQSISLFVTPTWVPEHAVARAAGRMQQQMEKAQAAGEALRQALPSGNATNEAEEALVGALDGEIATLSLEIAVANGFSAMRDADQAMRQYAEIGRVQARYVAPRLLASALDVSYTETPTTALKARLNLMRRDLELTPYPGQNPEVVYGVRMAQGIRSMTSEHMTLATLADPAWEAGPVKSVLGVMEAATQQEIGYTLITPDKPWAVQELAVSDDAKARMLSSLEQGFAVMTPQAAPMIDGQPYTAWFEINLETGAVTDQDEYGNRTAIITYAKLQRGWQQKKCSGEKCEDVDARYALLGFIAGFTVRLLTRVVSTIGFVNLYVSGSPVIALIQSACIAYHEAAQQSGQVGSLPGQAKSSGCSIKQVLDFFDAVLWLAINMFVRFARDVHNCGVPKNPLTINSEFWSGITLLEVKFWSSKCVEFVAKMATLGITTPAEFMSKLFDANSVDPFKITAMLLPDLVEGVTGSEAVAFLSSGALSADLASIKLRIGGFDHGASVAAALISNRLSKDPDLPPEVGFNTAAPADRPVEATRTITPAKTLGSSLSSAFSAAHAHLHSPGVITVTDGALAINGGEVRASGARLLDANGAQLYSGDLTAQLSAQGARLTLVGQAILSGASDASLWQQDGQLAGQATLTDAHRLTLHSSAPMTLHLGAGAVVNGTRWDQPMQVVFSSAEGRRVERMAWLNSSAVAWASSNATVHLSTIAGSLGGASNAVVSALGFAGNGQATTSGAGALNLTVAGSTATLLSAAPTWSMSGTRQLLAPNLSANRSLSLTLSAMLDEQRVNYFFEAADTAGQLTVERLPDQMSDDSLSGKLFLREDDYRAALVANTQVSLSARVPALEVSVAPDELNKPIWGEFPYYGVMGLLYNATITYTAATSGVFDLALSGFPAGWASLSREQIALEKGQTVGVGIVISPPLGAMPLPGTTIPFTLTVTQVGGGSLSAVGSAEWRAPETGLPGVMFDPNVRTEVAPTETVVAGLYVFNGGAISDTFTISAATNVPTAVSAIPDLPISVSVGVDDVTRVPVTVTFDAEPGQLIAIAGIAGPYRLYTRTAMTHQRFAIVPVEDIPLYERAYALRGPGCNARLAHATYELAQHTSAYRLNKVGIAEVEAAKARLAGVLPCYETLGEFTATQTVSAALTLVPTNTQELADALDLLHEQVKPVLDYQVALQVQPALTVARVGQPVSVPVVLEHTGNLTGAFTLLVTDTVSGLATVTTTLGPGQRFTHTVSFTPSAAGTFFITATAQTPAPQARAAAAGTVLAYERWTDILTVKGSPDFVETGSSSAALSADVVNYTPLPQPVTIYLTMTAPNGSVYYTAQVTHTAPKGVSNVPLGTAHFMNAAAGVYRLEARLVEEDRTALGGVSAGAGMRVTTRSSPLIVPPGDVTATTWITTERTVYGSGGMFEVGVPISGGVDLTITLNAALHSGSTPSAGVAVTVPAGIYDAIYITGAVRWHDGGQWYGQVDIYDTSNDKYYMLGHGVNTALGSFDPFVGGLPTMEAAGAYHTGRFIRLRITDTAVLRLYIYDTALTGSSANIGAITVRLVQVGGPDNTLKRRMEAAMHHATPRHALDAIQWDRWTGASTDAYGLGRWFQVNHNCNGCHIQAQGIAGLSALNTKLKPSPVDERMTEWLSTRIRGWQVVPTGTVGGHWEGYHIMSSLAMWAWAEQLRMETNLGRAPSPTVTNAMTRALGWALPYYRSWNVWQTDRPREFPWQTVPNQCYSYFDFSPMTTYFIMTALRQAYDLTGNISYLSQLTNAAITLATRVNWRGTCSGERYPHRTALVLLGLQEAVDVMTDTAQIQIVREALAAFENDLRVTQQLTPTTTANDGGWRRENMTSGPSDPYITAMALYALARQGVRSTDINLVRASEFLLERQDSWWNTNISAWVYTSPRTGRWWSYSASTSVAPTTWVDFALPLVYEAIGSYSLDVLHDTPQTVAVLDSSFNLPPQSQLTLPDGERRTWFYNQSETMRFQVISYTSVLTGLRPGDVRPLTLGTLVTYTIESGSNQIALPGSFVQAVKLVSVTPVQQTIGVGQTARYTLTLRNPLDQPATYTVRVSGLAAYDADQTFTVTVPANGQLEHALDVFAPLWMPARQDALWVTVNDGQDSDVALLEVVRHAAIAIQPSLQRAAPGQTVTFTVNVEDLSGQGSTVDLRGQVGSESEVNLGDGLIVPANATRVVTWVLSALAAPGLYPVRARAVNERNIPEAIAQLDVVAPKLQTALGSAAVGAGMPAVLTSTTQQQSPDLLTPLLPGAQLSVQAPAGWQVLQAPTHLPADRLVGHGDVIVLPPAGTPPGTYDVTLSAVMTGYPFITAQATGRVTVLSQGLVVSVRPATQTVNAGDTFEFEALVTNTGTAADQVVVSTTGMLASHVGLVFDAGGSIVATNRLTLAPGQTARFIVSGQADRSLIGGTHPLAVLARSLSAPTVQAVDYGWLTVNGRPEVALTLTPTYQLVDAPEALIWLKLSNIGSAIADPATVMVAADSGAAAQAESPAQMMLMPYAQAAKPVSVWLPRPGRYVVTATAGATDMSGVAVATATIEYRMTAAMAVADAVTWPGQPATAPLTVTNLRQSPMNNLSVRVSVPAGPWRLDGVSAGSSGATKTIALGAVQPGERRVEYQVTPDAPLPYGAEVITVTAELLLNGEVWQVEQQRVLVRAPDLRGSALSLVGQQVFVHDVLTYTWRLRNTGDADAINAQAVVTLPTNAQFEFKGVLSTSSGSATWDSNSRRLTWQGDLTTGGEAVIVFAAQASFGLPQGTLNSPFEVAHAWRPTHYGTAQYEYPYRVYFMLVRNNAP